MAVLEPGADLFAGVPDRFTSPFPSSAGQLEKFRQLSGDAGVYSAAQALSWQDVTQMAMVKIATSPVVGGLRQAMMSKLVQVDAGVAGDVIHGIFGRPAWPASTSPKDMGMAALKVGLNLALDAISAVPIWGQVAAAVVAVGKWFWKLAHSEPEQQELIVPWQEFSAQSDEDFVNSMLLRNLVPTVDWTDFWRPPLNPAVGWKIAKTKKGGDTRAFGPFTVSGSLEYVGYGMMPGTQRMVDLVQLAPIARGPTWRNDAVTNVGDYYPSMAQWGTAAWGWMQKMDGVGMFNVRAGELGAQWKEYWDSFFADGFDAIKRSSDKGGLDSLYIAKALLKFVVVRSAGTGFKQVGVSDDFLAQGANLGSFMSPEIWKRNPFGPSRLQSPYQGIIAPALAHLKQRQWAALSNTLACAYVRPEPVDGLPAHGAFLDTSPATDSNYNTWGEQLAARCRKLREILLTHDARYDVDIADARAVDGQYAERLAASKGKVGAVKFTGGPPKLEQHVPKPPDAQPPQGGSPFGDTGGGGGGKKRKSTGIGTPAKVVIAAGLGYGAYRLTRRRGRAA